MIDYVKLADRLIDLRIRLIRGVYTQMLHDLKGGDVFILHYLESNDGPVRPKDLSDAMSVSTARITNLLNKMEENGEIKRCVDPRDKRQVFVVITEKGRARNLQIRNDLLPNTSTFLEILGPDDAAAYVRIQEKLWQTYTETHQNKNDPEL